jgi:hypothetical protein
MIVKIKELLKHQKYQNYVVSDIGTFPQCVPSTNAGEVAKQRYAQWKSSTAPTLQPLLLNPKASTAKTFINATKNIAKVAECSNFAYHAIGVLLRDQEVAQKYNICLAGIMSQRHNIAVLFPKDALIDEEELQNGNWPEGILIVDPWAVGMGHSSDCALAVPVNQFIFKKHMQPFTLHYQSKEDASITESKEKGADITDPSVDFTALDAVPQALQEEYAKSQFDESLNNIKTTALGLHRRGYISAFNKAVELYNQVADERNSFMRRPFSEASSAKFANNTEGFIVSAQKSELSHFRGFTKYFFGLINSLIYLVTQRESSLYTTKTSQKIAELDNALRFFKPKSTAEEIETSDPALQQRVDPST